MKRSLALAVAATFLAPCLLAAQEYRMAEAKISNAQSAAPRSIAANATILDWPSEPGGQFVTLRAGTNGWSCLPHMPGMEGNAPMCVEQPWLDFLNAVMARRAPPRLDRVAIGYMIAPGGAYGSNTDPHATGPTPTNQWGYDPPHLMILVPDPAALKGLPTRRESGAPWVMFPGTPYAHIMVPLEERKP